MGHTRLGTLPRTREWRDVVSLIAAGADVAQIAQATIMAAEKAFSFVSHDRGYNQAVWLLIQLGQAGKSGDPIQHLAEHGVHLPEQTSLPGIILAISQVLDNPDPNPRSRDSDLGELAHRALVDAVIERLEPKLQQQAMFNMQSELTVQALAEFGSKKEFQQLARRFYARLTQECLGYFLSRTLATQLGDGQRFATLNQKGQFDKALETHCQEASFIVDEYAGSWFSLHFYEEQREISRETTRGFASYALKKIKDELQAGAQAHV